MPEPGQLHFPDAAGALEAAQLVCQDGGIAVAGGEAFDVVQTRQILHVDDWCNECDDCETFCVHEGKPFFDKPRLFLTEADYLLETDNAFHVDGDTYPATRRRQGFSAHR